MPKYISIFGTIMSGLGKGVLTASIGKILQKRGLKVSLLKFDGYLNYDCGTMNPYRHGEVFVLDDGTEVDMDFGTYERFLGKNLTSLSSLTGGKVFKTIIERERKGHYLGEDVQFIPHVTNFIKDYIRQLSKKERADITLIEVGGTVGDIENAYFIEALRQLSLEEEFLAIQLTYVPELNGEQKTKPTQHSNRLLRGMGITPKIIVCRSNKPLGKEVKEKISLYTNVPPYAIFSSPDLEDIYSLPLKLEEEGMYEALAKHLNLPKVDADWEDWKKRINIEYKGSKKVAIVGKYSKLRDAYVSILEALEHASRETRIKVKVEIVDSERVDREGPEFLRGFDGIIIAGGFGSRGIEGKIKAIQFAREKKIPLLGLCLGMQLMVVEWARNVIGWKDANSTEFDKETKHPVIDILQEQKAISELGGTMRLGGYDMDIIPGTKLYEAYGKERVRERHRHRYEVNPEYVDDLIKSGLVISAFHKNIVEAVEYKDSFGIGTQAHPEFNSKFEKPSPLFIYFLRNL